MFARGAEIGLGHHPVDLLAHLGERRIDAVPFRLDVLGHRMLDAYAGLVENRDAARHAFNQLLPDQTTRPLLLARTASPTPLDPPRACDPLPPPHPHPPHPL